MRIAHQLATSLGESLTAHQVATARIQIEVNPLVRFDSSVDGVKDLTRIS